MTCFKESQKCNLHAECDPDPAKDPDIAEDELDCDEEYRRKRLIPKEATFRCQSPHHNKETVENKTSLGVVWLKAILEDGKPECWKEEDEIERSTYLVSYYLPGLELAKQ